MHLIINICAALKTSIFYLDVTCIVAIDAKTSCMPLSIEKTTSDVTVSVAENLSLVDDMERKYMGM